MGPRFILPLRRRRGREAGSAAVEFALVSVPVIFLVMGTYNYFLASYQTDNLAGAGRAVAELARNNPSCVGNLTATNCLADTVSLINEMGSNGSGTNNTLMGLSCCIAGAPTVTTSTTTSGFVNYAPIYLYSCTYNSSQPGAPPSLSTTAPNCNNPNGDNRVLQYVQVTMQKGLQKLFAWDPWSSSPLTATLTLRTQ